MPYNVGDKLVHKTRPEWGVGTVRQATHTTHNGQPAQRLLVDFVNHGRLTLNSAIAPIRPHQAEPEPAADDDDRGWLAQLEGQQRQGDKLWSLPEVMTDPFVSTERRLQATLEGYRHTRDGRGLMDWAVAQTQLTDPFSRYTRNELEQGFDSFRIELDRHVRELLLHLKKTGQHETIDRVRDNPRLPRAGREALARIQRRL